MARRFREVLGLENLYVADLDAIAGSAPARGALEDLLSDGFRLLVDPGVRSAADLRGRLADLVGRVDLLAALETLEGPEELGEVLEMVPELVFSLDLKGGKLLVGGSGWEGLEPFVLAGEVLGRGVKRLLVLDLAAVGGDGGPAHLELLKRLVVHFPGTELLTGGGIRSVEDLALLASAGLRGVLVASALHDGRLGRAEIERIQPISIPRP